MQHQRNYITAGQSLDKAKKAVIFLHGRGATAHDILSLRHHLPVSDFYCVAPQATNFTWYPYSFMADVNQNQPWLNSAVDEIANLVDEIKNAGIPAENIFIVGFSQGACLTLEFATRNAQRWGGVIALTGGLIGDKLYTENYSGDFNGTPVFISNSENDMHVPLSRSEDSKRIMEKLGANVKLQIYPGRPHTILEEELTEAAELFS